MSYSSTAKDGSTRDAALKRRDGAVREAPKGPGLKTEAEKATEPKADELRSAARVTNTESSR